MQELTQKRNFEKHCITQGAYSDALLLPGKCSLKAEAKSIYWQSAPALWLQFSSVPCSGSNFSGASYRCLLFLLTNRGLQKSVISVFSKIALNLNKSSQSQKFLNVADNSKTDTGFC